MQKSQIGRGVAECEKSPKNPPKVELNAYQRAKESERITAILCKIICLKKIPEGTFKRPAWHKDVNF